MVPYSSAFSIHTHKNSGNTGANQAQPTAKTLGKDGNWKPLPQKMLS